MACVIDVHCGTALPTGHRSLYATIDPMLEKGHTIERLPPLHAYLFASGTPSYHERYHSTFAFSPPPSSTAPSLGFVAIARENATLTTHDSWTIAIAWSCQWLYTDSTSPNSRFAAPPVVIRARSGASRAQKRNTQRGRKREQDDVAYRIEWWRGRPTEGPNPLFPPEGR